MRSHQSLLIKDILIETVKLGAADLHFSVGNKPVYKLNGIWMTMEERDIIDQDFMLSMSESILDEVGKQKLNQEKEINFSHDFDRDLRFKINIFFQKGVLSATFRYISSKIPTLEALGVNPSLKNLCHMKKGLVIVAGPFGSGRSSTSAAMIEEINRNYKRYIITIEKPIEYIFTNNQSIIEQREVGKDTVSFEEALKYYQQEEGDVLYLDSVSNNKVWPLVLEIANGSSLVITNLNADTATKTIASILDGFKNYETEGIRDLLSESLKAVICQKILPKNGGGLVLIQEILLVNDAVKSIIKNGTIAQIENIIQVSRKEGMISFNQAISELAVNRKISVQDAMDNVADKKILENILK